jgi:sialate O-acetylesterase
VKFLINVLLFLLPFAGHTQLQLAPIFTDGMVFQRGVAVPVWGKGMPGAEVEVTFNDQAEKTAVKADSTWRVWLGPQSSGKRHTQLLVQSGQSEIQLSEILVGDVWLCLGQSNMQWPMQREMHFLSETPNSNQPNLRFFNPSYAGEHIFGTPFADPVLRRLNTKDFYTGSWEKSDSSSIRTMSAVAYYFGKSLLENLDLPIGLIDLSIGGAPIETFIPVASLVSDPEFSPKVSGNWLQNEHLPIWVRERGLQNLPGQRKDAAHPFQPGFAYAAGIAPLLPFPVKGILWYQGESNAQEPERVEEYGRLCSLMVSAYRTAWGNPQLPFYFVQLSSIDTVKYKGQLWPEFRDMQRRIQELIPYSGMAVSSDAGALHDVHPTDKKVVGARLARWALHATYSQRIMPSGPLPLAATYSKGIVKITFKYGKNLHTVGNVALQGFSLDGNTPTIARISGKEVWIPASQKPSFVFYGWQPYSLGNLYNDAQLPASTFKIPVR